MNESGGAGAFTTGEKDTDDRSENPTFERAMPMLQHLDELRRRVTRSVAVLMIAFLILMVKSQTLLNYLKTPLVNALPPGVPALHFTGPLDVMFTGMKVSFMAAVVVTSPFWLREFWKFFEPGLYPSERKYVLPFIWGSVLMFLGGVAFCYFLALPLTLGFLIQMGVEVGVPIITVTDYTNLLILMFAGFGLVFEAPLILILLAMLEIVDSKMLAAQRRAILVVLLIVAAILTPGPDPVSQFVMAVPLYVLFEASIVIIRWLERRRGTNEPATTVENNGMTTRASGRTGYPTAIFFLVGAALLAAFGTRMEEASAAPAGDTVGKSVASHSSWSFGAGMALHELTTDGIHDIRGKAARISLGYVASRGRWDLSTTLDLVLGPYEPINPGQLRRIDVDYNGTGITITGNYNLRPEATRAPALMAGIGYIDATGRAIGGGFEEDLIAPSATENTAGRTALLDNYVLRSTRLSAIAGASLIANWRKPRKSNSREDLKTTIDGYVISAWLDYPIVASYTAKYDELMTTGSYSKDSGLRLESQPVSDRGSVHGYSIVIQTTALLGG
jgi:sec-independent protein translocase protein TatC